MGDPLLSVIGSRTRAYALAILAGTRIPQTAYRIAKLGALSAPNVYVELRNLAKAGVVEKRESGWVLSDDRVRQFCEGQGPLYERRVTLESKRGWARRNRRRIAQVLSQPLPAGVSRRGPGEKLLREFSRSPTKNDLLRAAGLRVSRHRSR